MTNMASSEVRATAQRVPPIVQAGRIAYTICATLFGMCVVLQVFFAGAGALVHPDYWQLHGAFGMAIGLLALIMVIVALAARLPWRMVGLNVLLVFLFVMQIMFLWVIPRLGLPVLRALHAVNALAFFWIALYLGQRAWQLIRDAATR